MTGNGRRRVTSCLSAELRLSDSRPWSPDVADEVQMSGYKSVSGESRAAGLLIVFSDVSPGYDEVEYNQWYDEVHAPEIIRRGAAVRFRRLRASGIRLLPEIPEPGGYVCIYEIEARTQSDVEAVVDRMQRTRHQSAGVNPALDMSRVQAGFYVPIPRSDGSRVES